MLFGEKTVSDTASPHRSGAAVDSEPLKARYRFQIADHVILDLSGAHFVDLQLHAGDLDMASLGSFASHLFVV